MQPLADDQEQVAFWRRHTAQGVGLSVAIPAVVALRTLAVPAPDRVALLVLAALVAGLTPLLLLLPVDRIVRAPLGRLFFDGWEVFGILVISMFALLDGGPESPYVMFFPVLLAHAALAYPPTGMALAGGGNVIGYLGVALLGGGAPTADVVAVALGLVLVTAVCAYASWSHVRAYERTSAYADQIAVLAARDGLTGCLNHRTFHERLQAEARVAGPDHPLSLLVIDVDDFKAVNDTHGHPAGDSVLQQLGGLLAGLCRQQDVAGRLGGDEFALLLPHTRLDDAVRVGERLRARLAEGHLPCSVTVSIGGAVLVEPGSVVGLLADADCAVYLAKRGGRDRVVVPGQTRDVPVPAQRD